VLVVGQTPLPVNGQAVMIQELLDGEYAGIALHHVRLNFSRSITICRRLLWSICRTY
jgi:hypothetical protein